MGIDDVNTDGNQQETDSSAQETAQEQTAGKHDDNLSVALKREREQRQALSAKLAQIEAEREEAARKAAEEKGEFENLYRTTATELEAIKAEHAELKAAREARLEAVKASNAERLKALPEHIKSLHIASLDPDTEAAWLSRAEATAGPDYARGTRAGGGKTKPSIPDECKADARRVGKDPEYWFPIWKTLPAGKRWLDKQKS